MLENRANKLLVIQARLDTGVIQREQSNLRNIAKDADVELTFANPLKEGRMASWHKPDALLHEYGGSLWLGSSDFNLDEPTKHREKYVNRTLPLAQKILSEGESALGICMGHQAFAHATGEKVWRIAEREETGTVQLNLTEQGQTDPILEGLPASFSMVYGHNNSVEQMPQGFTRLGRTDRDPHSALRKDNVITFQGHPEITDVKELRKRVEASKGTTHEYSATHPFHDPHPTHRIIINFLNEVKTSAR